MAAAPCPRVGGREPLLARLGIPMGLVGTTLIVSGDGWTHSGDGNFTKEPEFVTINPS